MMFPATYVPKHRGTMTQTYVRVWEIAKACGVQSIFVMDVLRLYGFHVKSASSRVPLAWAVGTAHLISGVAE